ncbi:MAG: hypothetical protein QOH00_502 [Gaiellales bacterium]|nr:hypothetical protein [Gaiellales bacterium]
MTAGADPVHVVNGDSVGGTLAGSGIGGSVIVWRDVLCEGPVPPGEAALVREARARFLAGAGMGSAEEILADLEGADDALLAALADHRETVLWFEHDLHDQLQLIQILSRIAGHPARDAARLITLDSYPGHPRFAGLGELSASELAELWPRRRPVGGDAFAAATRAYDAFRRGDSRALAALGERPAPGLPYLAAAIRRLLEERPWVGSGLARSERQILRAVAAGARTPAAVFAATWQMEEAPYLGDSWLFRRIDELAQGKRALLERSENQLRLTAEGQNLLAG